MGLLLCGTALANLDGAAWRAFEAVEEAWQRERHAMLVQQAPAALNAARLDLEIRLLELRRRALEFKHIQKCDPSMVSSAVWQLASMTPPPAELEHLASTGEYRRLDERIRQLQSSLRNHPQYTILKRAQTRLWKTPQYRDAHRRYTGRIQDLQSQYGGPPLPSVSTVN